METHIAEIAPNIYRLSTYVEDADFMYNQFLVVDEEPLLFQTGLRAIFPLVESAVARLMPIEQLRWITFGHVEADECGSMNLWLAAAPNAEVAHGELGCMVSVNDLADLKPQTLGLMHGPSYAGDCSQALCDLASAYEERLDAEGTRIHGPVSPVT